MIMRTPALQVFATSFLVFFVVACTGPEMALRLGPTAVQSRINDLFEFQGKKEDEAERLVKGSFRRFKEGPAKEVSAWIRKSAAEFQRLDPQNPQMLRSWYEKKSVEMTGVLKKLNPLFVDLINGLARLIEEKEWATFNKNFNTKTAEMEKETNKKGGSRIHKNLQRFFGKLDSDQKKLVDSLWQPQAGKSNSLRVQNRRFTMGKINSKVGPTFDQNKLREVLADWAMNFNSYQDPVVVEAQKARVNEIVEILVKLHPTLTADQKNKALGTAQSWANALH